MLERRNLFALAASSLLPTGAAAATSGGTLRIAMTAADLPTPGGIPNNGGEGARFLSYPVYDSLINWELLKRRDHTADVRPGLATEWAPDPENPLRWIFKLRPGVKFHDGSTFDADAVVWNLERSYDPKSSHYDATGAPIVTSFSFSLDKWEKVDDMTVALWSKYPFSFFPYQVARILMASPAQYRKVGGNWPAFLKEPSGTGPFRITRIVSGRYIEMSRNPDYWEKACIPKLDKMVVYPMPETTTRLAALRSGQVDWIEVPPPDAIPSLKQAGFQISLWPYPHTYPYFYNCAPNSPFHDVRVRQALNYGIDRDGLCKLINGTGRPAIGFYPPEDAIFGKPKNLYHYDPARAAALLKQAGYETNRRLKAKIMISTSGSGQMLPIPINEFLQQNLATIGVDLSFDVVEWGTMLVAFRAAPDAPQSHGDDAMNISLGYSDPATMFRFFATKSFSPGATNWGHYSNPAVDAALDKAQATFNKEEQTGLLRQAHEIIVDDAAWLFICHDLNPRAMSKHVKGFEPAQSWYQDFTQITMES